MTSNRSPRWRIPSGSLGILTLLCCFFLVGGGVGGLVSSWIGEDSARSLQQYLYDYMTLAQGGQIQVSFWTMLWEQLRFLLGITIFGMSALGLVGVPALFFIRGFLFSFSVSGICRVFGTRGLVPALFLFGIPAFLWAPILFLAGMQCAQASYLLFRAMLGEHRLPFPYTVPYWSRLGLLGAILLFCVVLEYVGLPVLLKGAAELILGQDLYVK